MSTSNTRFVINLNPSTAFKPVWLRSIRPSDWSAHGPVVVATNDRSEAAQFLDFYAARDLCSSAIGWPDSRVEEIEIAPPTTPAEIDLECWNQERAEDIALVSSRMVSARPAESEEQKAARLHHAEECLYAIELANKPLRAALAKFGVLAEASQDASGRASRLRAKWLKTGDKRSDLRRAEIIAETMKEAAGAALAEVRRLEAAELERLNAQAFKF